MAILLYSYVLVTIITIGLLVTLVIQLRRLLQRRRDFPKGSFAHPAPQEWIIIYIITLLAVVNIITFINLI